MLGGNWPGDYLLGIDSGTSRCKSLLFDFDGCTIARAKLMINVVVYGIEKQSVERAVPEGFLNLL